MIPQPKPSIVSRSSWGARSASCSTRLSASSVKYLVVHHCASNNSSVNNRTERQHQKYLQDVHLGNKWCDIGYHYGVRKNGLLLAGRSTSYQGAHVSGYNNVSIGVVVHGNYETRTLTSKQQSNLVNLLAWLCYRYNLSASSIKGHRNLSSTACPERNIYNKLSTIRSQVNKKLYEGPRPI